MTMPHVNSGGSDDIYGNSDEVKVYRDEGDEENEKRSSENLSEDKLGLVTETEEAKGGYAGNEKADRPNDEGKSQPEGGRDGPFGYLPNFPPYHNGSSPTTMGSKVPMLQSPLGVMMGYNNEPPFTSPPPAHMGIPPVTIDPKTGLPRHAFPYHTTAGQFPPSLYPDVSWQRPPGYPISSGALGGHYPPSFINSSARFPAGFFPHGVPPGMPHGHLGAGPKQEGGVSDNHRHGFNEGSGNQSPVPEKKKPHIKKPLNAFMLFMKEQRAKVVAECTLKESAAINQILGRRWHSLDRADQAKYYEMAKKEKELHLQLYPGWSARDNYATHTKKKKRKKETSSIGGHKGNDLDERFMENLAFGECTNNAKKCRARYGMEQQKNWCKPCRRKKKCIRIYDEGGGSDEDDGHMSDSQVGGDSIHDSDSMLGSPAHSSTSDDPFSTPHKSRLQNVESPLVHDSSRDLSDMDTTIKAHDDILPAHKSPFSMFKISDNNFLGADRYLSPRYNFPPASSPVSASSKSSGLNRSYSIESLAKSSVNSDCRETGDHNRSFDYALSPLSSPGDFSHQNSPKFSISTFAEDINKNLSPKKKPSGLSNSFSISTLSVSAVTPSGVHCS
ncbi:transcription factor 7-like 2 isoform X4 [Mercenaria mercenaria]|uniref:transcription factor 7-like 2 isoform X4 n=1 Tax=Mercenaria mercenaria TaxID=6596 RepID=UPI00234E8653|nr:transcription factor 7-like 2 isoform X4 [Mercenaria mercenaria]